MPRFRISARALGLALLVLLALSCGGNDQAQPSVQSSAAVPQQSPPSRAAPRYSSDAFAAAHAEDVGRWYAVALWNDTVAANERAVAEAAQAAQAQQSSGGGGTYSGGSTGTVNGYPCGGSLPTCHVLACESGGNPYAENGSSSASGLWQILDSTWAGFGGYSHAASAPVSVQNAKAAALWAGGAGASHWAACL